MDEETRLAISQATEQFTPQQVADAITEGSGWMTVAGTILGCSASTVSRYIKKYPLVQEAYAEALEKQNDNAEKRLFELIDEKNPAAVIFYAKTRMRNRGYTEKVTVEIVPYQVQSKLVELCQRNGINVEELLMGVIAELEQPPDEPISVDTVEGVVTPVEKHP